MLGDFRLMRIEVQALLERILGGAVAERGFQNAADGQSTVATSPASRRTKSTAWASPMFRKVGAAGPA